MTDIAATPQVVGIDVAKAHLDLHLLPEGRAWRIAYTPDDLARLVDELAARRVDLVVMEASGGYERACADGLAGAGLAVAVVNPRQIRRFAGALGRLAKTDAVDAALIADYGARIRPPARHRPDPARSRLAALVARRRQLVAMAVVERQRADPDRLDDAVVDDIARHLRFLEESLADIERRIAALIADHPLWSHLAAALQAVKGVGPQTATALLTHLPELGTIGRRQIAALAGLAPIARDSGTTRGRRFVQGGRTALKTALYLAALSAARFNPALKTFYQRLRHNGKPPKAALVAVARKLLTILNAIAKQSRLNA